MLRIIHRVQDGVVSERLASLDGSGREFIRTGANLTCYLPDKRTVLVEQRPPQEPLVGFPAVNDQTASFYDIREVGRTRFNRRDTHVITVTPKDEFRYGYRLWIDDSTAMPLKTQLCDARGHVIEQIVFAELKLSSRIADAAFKPDVSTAGFQWLRNDAPPQPPPTAAALAWSAMRLPPGFRMTMRSAQTLPGSPALVDHLVFTDGLASVSVFVETQQAAGAQSSEPESAARRLLVGVLDRGRRPQGDRGRRGAAGRPSGSSPRRCARRGRRRSAPGAAERVAAARLTVVHRHDCELCEEMLAELAALGAHAGAAADRRGRRRRRSGAQAPPRPRRAGAAARGHRGVPAPARPRRAAAAAAARAARGHARLSAELPYIIRPPLDLVRGKPAAAAQRIHAPHT